MTTEILPVSSQGDVTCFKHNISAEAPWSRESSVSGLGPKYIKIHAKSGFGA